MKEYKPECDGDTSFRCVLKQTGKKNLLAIGVNPSTADAEKPDPTVRNIINFSKNHDFDGWIMFNLYPQRATNPDKMDKALNEKLHKENLKCFRENIGNADTILCCWGGLINKRKYLKERCLKDISKILENKKCITLKQTKKGHPHHPLFVSLNFCEDFNLKEYLK